MQLGQGDSGMQTQTQSLVKFYKDGKISRDIALQYANKADELARAI
jgi:twitching motility protein PilT